MNILFTFDVSHNDEFIICSYLWKNKCFMQV